MKKLIFTLLFLGVIFLSGCTDSSEQDITNSDISTQPEIKTNDNVEPIQKEKTDSTSALITKSTKDMLPTGENIPTEFTMGQIGNEKKENMESSRRSFSKWTDSSGMIDIDFEAYKYDSVENARIAYDRAVKLIIDLRGYTELKSTVKAVCFAYKIDEEFGENICIKKNVMFTTYVTISDGYEKPEKYVNDMAQIFEKRIN